MQFIQNLYYEFTHLIFQRFEMNTTILFTLGFFCTLEIYSMNERNNRKMRVSSYILFDKFDNTISTTLFFKLLLTNDVGSAVLLQQR